MTLGRVCMKLVIVMGVTWIADVLSWVFGGPYYYWIVTDLINVLQGVFIFVVVGCQPQVRPRSISLLLLPLTSFDEAHFQFSGAVRRLWSTRSTRMTNTTTQGQPHSSSSQGSPSAGESTTNNSTTQNKIPLETLR